MMRRNRNHTKNGMKTERKRNEISLGDISSVCIEDDGIGFVYFAAHRIKMSTRELVT